MPFLWFTNGLRTGGHPHIVMPQILKQPFFGVDLKGKDTSNYRQMVNGIQRSCGSLIYIYGCCLDFTSRLLLRDFYIYYMTLNVSLSIHSIYGFFNLELEIIFPW